MSTDRRIRGHQFEILRPKNGELCVEVGEVRVHNLEYIFLFCLRHLGQVLFEVIERGINHKRMNFEMVKCDVCDFFAIVFVILGSLIFYFALTSMMTNFMPTLILIYLILIIL